MAMTAREAFEKGTATFNAHDIAGFAEVLADDVVFTAPGGMHSDGKAACAAFFGGWFTAFPDAHVEVQAVHIIDDCRRKNDPWPQSCWIMKRRTRKPAAGTASNMPTQ
jgi:hypothetical protein